MKLPSFLKLVRFPNLLIVVATQYLVQLIFLAPAFHASQISPSLPPVQFALFVFTSVLIAAGGYIVNDIYDYEIDMHNKPEKVLVNVVFSQQQSWLMYWLVFIIGTGLSFYLAYFVGNLGLVLIYPAAFLLLLLYSLHLKRRPVMGNLIVSLFCAFVPGVVLFAERESVEQLKNTSPSAAGYVLALFAGYCLFAFLSTFVREIIKDIEDMHGDKKTNCRTLPLVYGEKTAKIWAAVLNVTLMLSLGWFCLWLFKIKAMVAMVFSVLAVLLPMTWLLYWLHGAKTREDFHRLSGLAKFVMIAGLFLLIVLWIF